MSDLIPNPNRAYLENKFCLFLYACILILYIFVLILMSYLTVKNDKIRKNHSKSFSKILS